MWPLVALGLSLAVPRLDQGRSAVQGLIKPGPEGGAEELASAVPGSSNNAYQYLQTNHPTVMQVAPPLVAAPIQQPGVTQAPPLHTTAPNQ